MTLGVSLGHICSISLEVGLLTRADQQGAAGAAPVYFGVPLVEGICCRCGVHMAGGGLCGVFAVAARAACCGIAGATGAAGATGGFAGGACSKDSGVVGATSAVVDVPGLMASR